MLLRALWHQQEEKHQNCDIAEYPLILSKLVLAVAMHYSMEFGVTTVAKYYDALKSLVLTNWRGVVHQQVQQLRRR